MGAGGGIPTGGCTTGARAVGLLVVLTEAVPSLPRDSYSCPIRAGLPAILASMAPSNNPASSGVRAVPSHIGLLPLMADSCSGVQRATFLCSQACAWRLRNTTSSWLRARVLNSATMQAPPAAGLAAQADPARTHTQTPHRPATKNLCISIPNNRLSVSESARATAS